MIFRAFMIAIIIIAAFGMGFDYGRMARINEKLDAMLVAQPWKAGTK